MLEQSEIKWRIVIATLFIVFFFAQTYVFFALSLESVLAPLAVMPETQSYTRDALLDVWSKMLIWPFMLFMLILAEIHAIWRARRLRRVSPKK